MKKSFLQILLPWEIARLAKDKDEEVACTAATLTVCPCAGSVQTREQAPPRQERR